MNRFNIGLGAVLLHFAFWILHCSAAVGTGPGTPVGGYQSEAQNYFTRAGVTNAAARARIDGLIYDLKAAGVWTNLVDLIPMAASMQPSNGTTLYTLRNVITAYQSNAVTRSTRSFDFDGVSASLQMAIPATTNYTVMMAFQSFTNANSWTLTALQGNLMSNGTHAYVMGALGGAAPGRYFLPTSGDPALLSQASTTEWGTGFSTTPTTYDNRNGYNGQYNHHQLVSFSSDNAGNFRCNSLGGTNGTYVNAAQVVTVPFTVARVGLFAFNQTADVFPFAGSVYGWALWSPQLTEAQAIAAQGAFRWLDPAPYNFIVEGDSMVSHANNLAGAWGNWENPASQMMFNECLSNVWCYHNMAKVGDSAANMQNTWTNEILQYAPGKYGVTRTVCLYYGSVNDLIAANDTGLTIGARARRFCAMNKSVGIETWFCTIPTCTVYTVTPTNWAVFHGELLANRGMYDKLIRWDNIVTRTNDNDHQAGDSFHLSTTGQLRQARCLIEAFSSGAKYIGNRWTWSQLVSNASTTPTTLLQRWCPANELLLRGEQLIVEVSGSSSNGNLLAKGLALQCDNAIAFTNNTTAWTNDWNLRTTIELTATNTMQARSVFTAGPNLLKTSTTSITVTNGYPWAMKVIGVGVGSGEIWTTDMTVEWKPTSQ